MSRSITSPLLRQLRLPAVVVVLVSGIMNLLALAGAIYMLQVYDRVLTSHSVPTLVALSLLLAGVYIAFVLLDVLRGQVLMRIGLALDTATMPLAFEDALARQQAGQPQHASVSSVRDVDALRNFLGGSGPLAVVDLPWTPLFLGFVTILSPTLGLVTAIGMAVLVTLSLLTDVLVRRYDRNLGDAARERASELDAALRNCDVIAAMGMAPEAADRFLARHADVVTLQRRTGDALIMLGSVSKVARMALQSAILGLGAYLAIRGDMSMGAIVAASIASARALAPVEQAITGWQAIAAARQSWLRLRTMRPSADVEEMALQSPRSSVELQHVQLRHAATGAALLAPMSLRLEAGQGLAIVGASGAGKSTLARVIAGIAPPTAGDVRFDGAPCARWSRDERGRFIGYMPQHVELIPASIAQNIARLAAEPDHAAVVAAAKLAGLHDLVLDLPNGYQTEVGAAGWQLPAGRCQQIGLARALYGDPFLVVLDEPNASLDQDGEAFLVGAIRAIRDRGGIAVVVAHRRGVLAALDTVAVLDRGQLRCIGAKEDVLRASSARLDGSSRRSNIEMLQPATSRRNGS